MSNEYMTFSVTKHGDTEARRKKDEGGRMMDEKEETSITISSFILSRFSPCLCVSVFRTAN